MHDKLIDRSTHLEIAPSKAHAKPWEKVEPLFDHGMYVIEEKLDGWRFLMHVGRKLPRMYLTGRRPSKTQGGKFSEKGLCAPRLAPDTVSKLKYTVIDGEVMPPAGAHFRDLAGIMNVTPEKAAARIREIGAYPQYYAFDILFYDGADVREEPWSYRKQLLEELVPTYWARNDLVSVLPHHRTSKFARYDAWIRTGKEGAILKDKEMPYGKGWIKVKRTATLDVVVTGYEDANYGKTGKFDGLIGALKVSVWCGGELVEVGQVSGMTDKMRKEFTENYKDYEGTVIEIAAQEMAKDRLRHPRFKRLRPEADPKTCTMYKMHEDLAAAR